MASKNNLSNFYNQRQLTEISRRGYYSEKIEFFIDKLKELATNSELKILDVACNDGYLSQMYSSYGQVTGVELNKQAALQSRKIGVRCLNIDIMDMPEKYNDKFDVVIAGDIIEHVFDTDKFLLKLYALLKPDGKLLLTTPNVASLGRRLMLLIGANPFLEYSLQLPYPEFNVGHIRYYTANNLHEQLVRRKFRNITIFGDRININSRLAIPFKLARSFPSFSRNLLAYCQK